MLFFLTKKGAFAPINHDQEKIYSAWFLKIETDRVLHFVNRLGYHNEIKAPFIDKRTQNN